MSKEHLNKRELKFIESGKRWNIHFEIGFSMLWVVSVFVPFIFMDKLKSPVLDRIFEDASFYSAAILIGLLVTLINQRWIRIVRKLMQE